ncbi:hypothetical protein JCM3766R1_001624 [Sporobolomyces carnicolor]
MDDLSYLEDRIGQLFYHYSIGSIRQIEDLPAPAMILSQLNSNRKRSEWQSRLNRHLESMKSTGRAPRLDAALNTWKDRVRRIFRLTAMELYPNVCCLTDQIKSEADVVYLSSCLQDVKRIVESKSGELEKELLGRHNHYLCKLLRNFAPENLLRHLEHAQEEESTHVQHALSRGHRVRMSFRHKQIYGISSR